MSVGTKDNFMAGKDFYDPQLYEHYNEETMAFLLERCQKELKEYKALYLDMHQQCDSLMLKVMSLQHLYNDAQEELGQYRKESDNMIQGRLGYNDSNGRYGLLVSDLWENDGFHCGECLDVLVDDTWVQSRMEMDYEGQWYLVDTPYHGDLEYIQARID